MRVEARPRVRTAQWTRAHVSTFEHTLTHAGHALIHTLTHMRMLTLTHADTGVVLSVNVFVNVVSRHFHTRFQRL